MSGWTLQLRRPPDLRVDLRGATPAAWGTLDAAHIERWPLGQGRETVALAEFFRVKKRHDDRLLLEGDLSRFDRVGWQMDGGELVVDGAAGHYAGARLRAGTMLVRGAAGDLAACEMEGGQLVIEGDAGAFVGGALPGSMNGQRGGSVVIKGSVGARCADRMRRGALVVFGDAGDFLASRMVAGTVAVGGCIGAHGGFGMRRGTLVFAGPAPAVPGTFVPAVDDVGVIWQLLARDLALHGGPFAGLPARRFARHRGDLAFDGKGEWFVALP